MFVLPSILAIGCCYIPSAPAAPYTPPSAPLLAPSVAVAQPVPTAGAPTSGVGFADELAVAQRAVAARDLAALRTVLTDDTVLGSFELDATTVTSNADTAVAAWAAHPAVLAELGTALEHCEVEPDEDGMVFVTCATGTAPGSLFAMWLNVDGMGDDFRIIQVHRTE